MKKDLWHYPRTQLAEKVLSMFDIGLSSSLTFFAPRRMGKTEFLLKDIIPLSEKRNWQVHYHSFLDADKHAQDKYKNSLIKFSIEKGIINSSTKRIKKVGASAMGVSAEIEMDNLNDNNEVNLISLIDKISEKNKTILLLDEVQTLAYSNYNQGFLASLRTALDTNKDRIKVLFTGSSREGLKKMFSSSKAPFFHFGQNLDLPSLEKSFTDHLCQTYNKATKNTLDSNQVWQVFKELDYVPQLIRSLIERIALNPGLTIEAAKQDLLHNLYDDRSYRELWGKRSQLEKLILREIALNRSSLYSKEILKQFASQLGINELKPYTIQGTIKTLTRKNFILRSMSQNHFIIEDPNFARWILEIEQQ